MTGVRLVRAVAICALLLVAQSSAFAQGTDVQALRQEIEQLRKELQAIQQQYGERLTVLETKLGAAQGAAAAPVAAPVATEPPPASASV